MTVPTKSVGLALAALVALAASCSASTEISGTNGAKDKKVKEEPRETESAPDVGKGDEENAARSSEDPAGDLVLDAEVPLTTTTLPIAPVRLTKKAFRLDTNAKWLACEAFLALANGDPLVARQYGFVEILANRVALTGLSAEDAEEAIRRFPMLSIRELRDLPSQDAARLSCASITSKLYKSVEIVDESMALVGEDEQPDTDQSRAFERLRVLLEEGKKRAAEQEAIVSQVEAERAQHLARIEALKVKAAADKAAYDKLLAERAAQANAANAARSAPPAVDLRSQAQALRQASNNIGWLAGLNRGEFGGMAGEHIVGHVFPTNACPPTNARILYRSAFLHPGAGWVYSLDPLGAYNARTTSRAAGGEGWKAEGPAVCVFDSPAPGTVALISFANDRFGGRFLTREGGGPPGDAGFAWTHAGTLGYIYPP